jgi:hypothetical protein
MPLLPIDLQTLFTQAGQVGKDQAVAKDQIPNAQAAAGTQIVRHTDARDKKVNEAEKQEGEGAEQIRRRGRRQRGKEGGASKHEKQSAKPPQKKSEFRDPSLGSRIDISG